MSPRSAAVPAASCGGVSPPAETPGETPSELAGEDACATSAALGRGEEFTHSRSFAGNQMVSFRSRPTIFQLFVARPFSTTTASECSATVGQICHGMP